jgi:hypothetical protein
MKSRRTFCGHGNAILMVDPIAEGVDIQNQVEYCAVLFRTFSNVMGLPNRSKEYIKEDTNQISATDSLAT